MRERGLLLLQRVMRVMKGKATTTCGGYINPGRGARGAGPKTRRLHLGFMNQGPDSVISSAVPVTCDQQCGPPPAIQRSRTGPEPSNGAVCAVWLGESIMPSTGPW